ncbi:uncharacterized protein LOC132274862 [Cornus florida]|uniref:uncharacterized protein LOC132274862 n=1 Tax=Cornus florida TaxID=4283 RepID=UPI0028979F65|nr:uncharacterized protein LOC132274862 [Cornus florida]
MPPQSSGLLSERRELMGMGGVGKKKIVEELQGFCDPNPIEYTDVDVGEQPRKPGLQSEASMQPVITGPTAWWEQPRKPLQSEASMQPVITGPTAWREQPRKSLGFN